MKLTAKSILQRYSSPSTSKDSPGSFYSWSETQVMMKHNQSAKLLQNKPHAITIKSISSYNYPYQLINSAAALETALKAFLQAKIIGIDCETVGGTDPHQAKIRLVQLAIPNHPVVIVDLAAINSEDLSPLRQLLRGNALKVGHNLKFEWMMLTQAGLQPSRHFFDTYLAYRVLTAGLKRSLSLEAIADQLLDVKLDKSLQTSDWSGELTAAQLQYAAIDAAIVLPLRIYLKRKLKRALLWETALLEFACLPAVAQIELNGMLLDKAQWQLLKSQLEQQRTELAKELLSLQAPSPNKQISLLPEFSNSINLRSPKQVLAALQAQGVSVTSTNTQTLIPLANEYPVIQALLDYRSLSTRISTFAEGLPQHIHPVTGRIHPNWFQIGAKSGRFSCREPNLQNIPRDKATRQCFKAATGYVLLKADYSQIELRIMAKVSGDRLLIAAYSKGEDLHKLTASLVLGKPLSDINPEDRQLGKIINFGLIYGMGAKKFKNLAQTEHGRTLSLKEASQFRKRFFESYAGIAEFHKNVRQNWLKGMRESRTLGGRRRLWSKDSKPLLNEMLNNPIQGLSADITKLALAKLFAPLNRTGARLICVIHDEILLECPIAEVETVKALLKRSMVWAGNKFLTPIPCEVEIQMIDSWGG
ncbi:MAG TPA: bifunctional 3'-5' exonuclease/DNA polymerase [Leptolyngbyaceae cyanobacterium]